MQLDLTGVIRGCLPPGQADRVLDVLVYSSGRENSHIILRGDHFNEIQPKPLPKHHKCPKHSNLLENAVWTLAVTVHTPTGI